MISEDIKNSDELALAMGHIFGDGGINSKGRVYYCNSEEFLIKEFVNSMNKIFNIKPWINKEWNVTRVVYPVSVGRDLWEIFGKFSFGKDTKIITTQIQERPLKWKVKMLQAWFNDDGSVICYLPNYKAIAIHQKLKHLIEFIKEILEEFNINAKIEEDDGKWLLRIFGYENMVKFSEQINFSGNYRKSEKLKEMIKSITRPCFVTKKKILKILEKSPKTIKEISKELDMDRNVVYGHLHGWKRRNRKNNQGLIDYGSVIFKKVDGINIYILEQNKN